MTFLFNFSSTPTPTKPRRPVIAFVFIATAIWGCSSQTGRIIRAQQHAPQTGAYEVVIVDGAKHEAYRVIGRVHAHTWAPAWLPWLLKSEDELIEQLKQEAAKLRADVIIDIKRYSRSQFEWREEHLMGTAARIGSDASDDLP